MFDFAGVQELIRSTVADLSGLPTQWEGMPGNFVDPTKGAQCLLSITSIDDLGWDEHREAQVPGAPPGQDLEDTYTGNRLVTLTVKVESYNQTPGFSAVAWVEGIRTKLWWRSSKDRLAAKRIAIVRSEKYVDLSSDRDDRKVSIAAVDIILCVRFEIQDPNRYPYIESVSLDGPFGPVIP